MNDADSTQERGLTTEQIAAAGTRTGQENVAEPASYQGFDDADAPLAAGDADAPPLGASYGIRERRPRRPVR